MRRQIVRRRLSEQPSRYPNSTMAVIPTELHLDPRAVAKLERWLEFIRSVVKASPELQKHFDDAFEEDCVPSSDVSFELYETGLGAIITARIRLTCLQDKPWAKIDLSIDDDNELTPDEWLN